MSSWQKILSQNIRSFEQLKQLAKSAEYFSIPKKWNQQFPLNIPLRLAKKIDWGNPLDPIFLQFVPLSLEGKRKGLLDPVQDQSFQKSSKLLHKYASRALLLSTSACAMNCRFCFRQNFPYEKEAKNFHSELKYLQEHPEILEVILSGGDPLSLSNRKWEEIITSLEDISHIKVLRIHTRFPLGIPERIDDEWLQIIGSSRLQVVFLLHVNHAKELDQEIFSALKKVQALGVPILSQTVLMHKVNDSIKALEELFLLLIQQGIIPYYLHQLDPVQGACHFEAEIAKGLELIEQLRNRLPGYAVPRYVQEIPGKPSKTNLEKD